MRNGIENMEEALKKIYKEALVFRDTTPHSSRRKRQAFNKKLSAYMVWLSEVEMEMQKAGYTQEEIAGLLKAVRKQHEREKLLEKTA